MTGKVSKQYIQYVLMSKLHYEAAVSPTTINNTGDTLYIEVHTHVCAVCCDCVL